MDLPAAHATGILTVPQPANILVARNGYAKLADFGLAKLTEGAVSDDSNTHANEARTRQGLIVARLPICHRSRPREKRSRPVAIFLFGIVLMKLLARKRPFFWGK